jgi:hypothetical protein
VVLLEALTGDRSAALRARAASASPAWDGFFARALAGDPAERFADAVAFRAALAQVHRAIAAPGRPSFAED